MHLIPFICFLKCISQFLKIKNCLIVNINFQQNIACFSFPPPPLFPPINSCWSCWLYSLTPFPLPAEKFLLSFSSILCWKEVTHDFLDSTYTSVFIYRCQCKSLWLGASAVFRESVFHSQLSLYNNQHQFSDSPA